MDLICPYCRENIIEPDKDRCIECLNLTCEECKFIGMYCLNCNACYACKSGGDYNKLCADTIHCIGCLLNIPIEYHPLKMVFTENLYLNILKEFGFNY